MNFAETKLPQNPLIEEAFAYSQNQAMTVIVKEFTKQFMEQIEMQYEQNKMMLDMSRRTEEITKEEYQSELAAMNKQQDQMRKVGPTVMKKQAEKFFKAHRVSLAEELAGADSASPEAIAAALLLDCTRSPVDAKAIAKTFGDSVADLASEIAHINAYPLEHGALIAAASDDAKRILMGVMISEFGELKTQAATMKKEMPEAAMTFSKDREKEIHADVMLLATADMKLAKRLTAAFNEAARELGSRYQMEVGTDNSIFLVQSEAPRINDPSRLLPPKSSDKDDGPKPPKPNGPSNGWGDNVF